MEVGSRRDRHRLGGRFARGHDSLMIFSGIAWKGGASPCTSFMNYNHSSASGSPPPSPPDPRCNPKKTDEFGERSAPRCPMNREADGWETALSQGLARVGPASNRAGRPPEG